MDKMALIKMIVMAVPAHDILKLFNAVTMGLTSSLKDEVGTRSRSMEIQRI